MSNNKPVQDGISASNKGRSGLLPKALFSRNWRFDLDFARKRAANVIHMMTGTSANALLMLASISLAARALGAEDFGLMIMILTLGRVCERIVRCETWQAIISYAAEIENTGNADRLPSLYLYGLLLDIFCALISAVFMIVAGHVLSGLLGVEGDRFNLVLIFALATALNIRSAPGAALRMSGKFKMLAYIGLISGTLRLALAATCYALGLGVMEFIIVWAGAQILDALLVSWSGLSTLRHNGIILRYGSDWKRLPGKFPGFLRFALMTNVSATLRTLTHEGDTLLVGFLAGNAAAGGYNLARRLAKIVQQLAEMIQTVIYPDLARMWTGLGLKKFRKLVLSTQAIVTAFVLICFVLTFQFGETIIPIVFGNRIPGIYHILIAQLIAVLFMLLASPTKAAVLAMKRPGFVLYTALISTIAFYMLAPYLVTRFGAIGASYAHLVLATLTAGLMQFGFWQGTSRLAIGMSDITREN